MDTDRVGRLEGLSEKIFLDRYAWKNADSSMTSVGDIVLVLTKDDPKFPSKEVGEVLAREGDLVPIKLRSGDTIDSTIEKLTLTIEKTPEEMWDRLAKAISSVEDERREAQALAGTVPICLGGLEACAWRPNCRGGGSKRRAHVI